MDIQKVIECFDSLSDEERNNILTDIIVSWSGDPNNMTLGSTVRTILNNKYFS